MPVIIFGGSSFDVCVCVSMSVCSAVYKLSQFLCVPLCVDIENTFCLYCDCILSAGVCGKCKPCSVIVICLLIYVYSFVVYRQCNAEIYFLCVSVSLKCLL